MKNIIDNNSFLFNLIDNLNSGIIITNSKDKDVNNKTIDPKIIYCNKTILNKYKYTKEELIGKSPKIFQQHNLDIEKSNRIRHCLENDIPFSEDIINYAKDGEKIFVHLYITPIYFENKRYFLGIQEDNVEKAKLTLELLGVHKILSAAFDDSPQGLALVNLYGTFIKVNKTLSYALDYSVEELTGKNNNEITNEYYLNEELSLIEKCIKKEIDNYSLYKKYTSKSGETIPALSSVSPILNEKQEVVCFLHNIQPLLHAYKDKEKFDLALRYASEAILDWHDMGNKKEVWWSDNFLTLLGYEAEDVGKTIDDLFKLIHKKDIRNIRKIFKQTIKEKKEFRCEFRLKTKKNIYKWFSLTSKVFFNIDGKPNRMVGVLKNIDSTKELNEKIKTKMNELENNNTELEHIIYSLSHDLKSPLFSIEGFAGILEEEIENLDTAQIRQNAEEIRQSIKGLRSTIEKVLEMSRVGRINSKPSIVDTKKILDQLVKMNKNNINKDINIKCEKHTKASLQEETIVSILQNLLSNSINHGKIKNKPLNIEVSFEKKRKYLFITYKDNGKGIEKEYQKNLFNPTKRSFAKGFGMIIIKKCVDFHKGDIHFYSEKDKGVSFLIKLKEM